MGFGLTPGSWRVVRDSRFVTTPTMESSLQDVLALCKKTPCAVGIVRLKQGWALRARRADVRKLKRAIDPAAVLSDSEEEEASTWPRKYMLQNLTARLSKRQLTDALAALPWKARAQHPVAQSSWIVCALEPAPFSHFMINNSLVMVREAQTNQQLARASHSKGLIGDVLTRVPALEPEDKPVSRLGAMHDDLEKKLGARFTQLLEDKLQESVGGFDARVSCIEGQVATNDCTLRDLVAKSGQQETALHNLHTRVDSVASEVTQALASTGQSLMAKFESMCTNMQASTQKSIDRLATQVQEMSGNVDSMGSEMEKRRKLVPTPSM